MPRREDFEVNQRTVRLTTFDTEIKDQLAQQALLAEGLADDDGNPLEGVSVKVTRLSGRGGGFLVQIVHDRSKQRLIGKS